MTHDNDLRPECLKARPGTSQARLRQNGHTAITVHDTDYLPFISVWHARNESICPSAAVICSGLASL
jgi:hypothetical protein